MQVLLTLITHLSGSLAEALGRAENRGAILKWRGGEGQRNMTHASLVLCLNVQPKNSLDLAGCEVS